MTEERLTKILEGQRTAGPVYRKQVNNLLNTRELNPLERLLANMVIHLTSHIPSMHEKGVEDNG